MRKMLLASVILGTAAASGAARAAPPGPAPGVRMVPPVLWVQDEPEWRHPEHWRHHRDEDWRRRRDEEWRREAWRREHERHEGYGFGFAYPPAPPPPPPPYYWRGY